MSLRLPTGQSVGNETRYQEFLYAGLEVTTVESDWSSSTAKPYTAKASACDYARASESS